MFLSPEKVLFILVVAVVVLGPDKLPRVTRQAAATWRAVTSFRSRLEAEARAALPGMPGFDAVSEAVRRPVAYLERLAGEAEAAAGDDGR